jgi:hypothetical protein
LFTILTRVSKLKNFGFTSFFIADFGHQDLFIVVGYNKGFGNLHKTSGQFSNLTQAVCLEQHQLDKQLKELVATHGLQRTTTTKFFRVVSEQ